MNTEPNQQLAVTEPSVAVMLQGALASIQSGQITEQHVKVLEGMMNLYERNDKREAEKAFAAAFAALQGETSAIAATREVMGNDGTRRYKFAPYEDIMKSVKPLLSRHGFSVSFDTKIDENRLTSICTLMHKDGHSKTNSFSVRWSKPPGASDPQGDMSTKSYAKRGALCDALNISIDHDDDARAEGAPIKPDQAEELRRRVKATGINERAFLLLALGSAVTKELDDSPKDKRAAFYDRIHDSKMPLLDAELKKREAKTETKTPASQREPGETGEDLF